MGAVEFVALTGELEGFIDDAFGELVEVGVDAGHDVIGSDELIELLGFGLLGLGEASDIIWSEFVGELNSDEGIAFFSKGKASFGKFFEQGIELTDGDDAGLPGGIVIIVESESRVSIEDGGDFVVIEEGGIATHAPPIFAGAIDIELVVIMFFELKDLLFEQFDEVAR